MGIGSVLQPSVVVSAGATRLSTCNPRKFSLAKASSLFNHRISFATTSVCRNRPAFRVKAEQQSTTEGVSVADISEYKNILLPITDKNPYLSEGTKQAVATSTTLAKKNGASITVVVIDESAKDAITDHETRLSSIRWHLSEGGFDEFGLMERLGEGKKPTAIIGEVADDMNLDLVVMSMESIHSKHVDGNLLAEFIPCPVLLLPL